MCPAHLQDRHFCSPIIDTEGEAERLKKEAMAKQIEQVKEEYEKKQRRKKEREKASNKEEKDEKEKKDEKDKGKDESKDKEGDSTGADNDQKDRDNKVSLCLMNQIYLYLNRPLIRQIASIEKDNSTKTTSDKSPRVFSLHKYLQHIHPWYSLLTVR